jgi:DNA-binding MarR family transcriptional regulator
MSTRTVGQRAGDDTELRRQLVETSIRFSKAYLRWIESDVEGGLSLPRLQLLEMLHCRGPMMMRELADELGMTARNMTAAVDILESDDLVKRTSHPTDRRATLVQLTPEGYRAADDALQPRLDVIGELFDDLSTTDQARLVKLLNRLNDDLRHRGQRV